MEVMIMAIAFLSNVNRDPNRRRVCNVTIPTRILNGEWKLKQTERLVSYWDTDMKAIVVVPEKRYKELTKE